jgi:hypothetical protein
VTFGILALEVGVVSRESVPITSFVLHVSALVAALIPIILFQPELRRAASGLEVTLRWPRQRAVLLSGVRGRGAQGIHTVGVSGVLQILRTSVSSWSWRALTQGE